MVEQPKERGQKPETILAHIKDNIPDWHPVTLDQVEIRRLSGLSNACYKVSLKAEARFGDGSNAPREVMYRKFECDIIDRKTEATIFRCMAESGQGAGLIFQNDIYRIE